MLQVERPDAPHRRRGPGDRARSGRLGLVHHTLPRNAPGCDGQGVCCFGCPTGAKRSTDVSYVPAALERGAQSSPPPSDRRRRRGRARARRPWASRIGRAFRVTAEAVVLAGGALMTPTLIQKTKLLQSAEVGRNLTIHPATKVMALFDEKTIRAAASKGTR